MTKQELIEFGVSIGYLTKEKAEQLNYEFPDVVRCKDCKHYSGQFCNKNDIYPWPKDEWYCADGEKK